jgi:hypothetical protein
MSQLAVLGHWRLPQDMDDLPKLTTRTFVGIVVAISGNVLISLALNLQKLAHKRAETNKLPAHSTLSNGRIHRISEGPSLDENDEDRECHLSEDVFLTSGPPANSELQPLVSTPRAERDYGSASPNPHEARRPLIFRLPFRLKKSKKAPLIPPATREADPHGQSTQREPPQEFVEEDRNEGEYLKSKLWYKTYYLSNPYPTNCQLLQVVRLSVNERWRNGQFHFIRIRACLRRSTFRHCALKDVRSRWIFTDP